MFKVCIAHLILLGWLSSLTIALPRTRPLSLSLSLENFSPHLNETYVNRFNSSQIIDYTIPQTQIRIVIYTGTSIPGTAMRNILGSYLSTAQAIMDKHGNVFMFPDPNVFKAPPKLYTGGLEISAHSTMVPGLKWIDLINALNGFAQIVLQRSLYKEVHMKLFDQPSGMEMGIVDLHRPSGTILADHGGPT